MAQETAKKKDTQSVAEVAEQTPVKLLQSNFKQAEFAYARMAATLPVGVPFEECLKAEFWTNITHIMRKNVLVNQSDRSGAIIEIRSEDHAFYAELYVRAVSEQGLRVAVIREPVYFGPAKIDTGNNFTVRWNPTAKGYEILRKADGVLVGSAETLKTKEDVQGWLNGLKG